MTDANTHTTSATQPGAGRNVIAVSFEDDANAYAALTALKELDTQGRVRVAESVVVSRGDDGQVVEKDRVESSAMPATAGGGLLGLLIGVIGGPLGVLVGGTYGLLVGSLFDLYDLDEADSSLAAVSTAIGLGRTGLLAVVDERSPEIVDSAVARLGGTVVRRPADEIEAEIAAAEQAERHAKSEARKELMRSRHERDKAAVDAKLTELKGKLRKPQHQPSGADEAEVAAAAGTT